MSDPETEKLEEMITIFEEANPGWSVFMPTISLSACMSGISLIQPHDILMKVENGFVL